MLKVGDKVIVKNNSHYSKPIEIIKVVHSYRGCLYQLKGAYLAGSRRFLEFREDELVDKEIWNSPLYKVMAEE